MPSKSVPFYIVSQNPSEILANPSAGQQGRLVATPPPVSVLTTRIPEIYYTYKQKEFCSGQIQVLPFQVYLLSLHLHTYPVLQPPQITATPGAPCCLLPLCACPECPASLLLPGQCILSCLDSISQLPCEVALPFLSTVWRWYTCFKSPYP